MTFILEASRYGLDWTEIARDDHNYWAMTARLYENWHRVPWIRIWNDQKKIAVVTFHDKRSVGGWMDAVEQIL